MPNQKSYPIPLPNFVDPEGISFFPKNLISVRYYARFMFQNRQDRRNCAIVILKNPSMSLIGSTDACPNYSIDATTENVLNFIYAYAPRNRDKQYKGVLILNLFPKYSQNPFDINAYYGFTEKNFDLNLLYCDELTKNRRDIINAIKLISDCTVICAWGDYGSEGQVYPMYYEKQIELLMKEFCSLKKRVSVVTTLPYTIKEPFFPKHGLAWEENDMIFTPPLSKYY